MRVGIDLDGCLFDFHLSLIEYLATVEHKYEVKEDADSWYFYRSWGMGDDEFIEVCNAGADAGKVFRGNIHEGAAESIERIRKAGHSVHIITDRKFGSSPEVSERATREWLEEHGIKYDTLDFSADKTVVPTDIMVEDKLENYDNLDAAGTMSFLINRPWNMPAGDGRRRISSISDFADVVLAFDKIMTLKI